MAAFSTLVLRMLGVRPEDAQQQALVAGPRRVMGFEEIASGLCASAPRNCENPG
jgi:hypothetical protein